MSQLGAPQVSLSKQVCAVLYSCVFEAQKQKAHSLFGLGTKLHVLEPRLKVRIRLKIVSEIDWGI